MASSTAQGAGAVLLLCGSNAFMTTAWYLHLKFKSWGMVKAIFFSWLIAFTEYCLQVPANRMGHFSHGGPFSAPQLKIIQEFISLTVFAIFSVAILKEKLRWVDLGAFLLIMSGVAVGMIGKQAEQQSPPLPPLPSDAPAPVPDGRRLLLMQPWSSAKSGGRTGSSGSSIETQESPSATHAGLPSGTLHAVHELRGTSSTQVLLAGESDVHAGSLQQGVHRRQPTVDMEAEGGRPGSREAPGVPAAGAEAKAATAADK